MECCWSHIYTLILIQASQYLKFMSISCPCHLHHHLNAVSIPQVVLLPPPPPSQALHHTPCLQFPFVFLYSVFHTKDKSLTIHFSTSLDDLLRIISESHETRWLNHCPLSSVSVSVSLSLSLSLHPPPPLSLSFPSTSLFSPLNLLRGCIDVSANLFEFTPSALACQRVWRFCAAQYDSLDRQIYHFFQERERPWQYPWNGYVTVSLTRTGSSTLYFHLYFKRHLSRFYARYE